MKEFYFISVNLHQYSTASSTMEAFTFDCLHIMSQNAFRVLEMYWQIFSVSTDLLGVLLENTLELGG